MDLQRGKSLIYHSSVNAVRSLSESHDLWLTHVQRIDNFK